MTITKNNGFVFLIIAVAAGVFFSLTTPLFAATTTDARTGARITKAKARADQEISRRVSALQNLNTRVGEIKLISAAGKSSIATTIQGQIDSLNFLKAKIAADTDLEVLKTDIGTITASYRIFALIMPEVRVIAAADRLAGAADLMLSLGIKLQARINEAQNAGKNVTEMNANLVSLNTKAASAKQAAQAAIDLVTPLVPDNGDKASADKNRQTLKDARMKIKEGGETLRSARTDGKKVTQALK